MSAPPVDRPRLLPHAIPLLRDRQSLQLGLCSDEALVLDGLTSREVDFVTGLDGTRDRAQVLREGRGERDEQLLHLLADAGVLAPAEARDRRQPPHPGPLVAVQGVGRLADEIALQLCDRRGARVARGERTGATVPTDEPPDLVVLVEHRAVGPDAREGVQSLRVPVLPVVHDGPHGTVGPLVVPGRSACLECLDLTRADQDPAWGHLLRQATTWSARPDLVRTDPDGELVPLLVATTVLVAGCALRGRCPVGVSLELSLPWPRPVQRQWSPHPACRCMTGSGAASVTMGA